jgi:hypothetical protein
MSQDSSFSEEKEAERLLLLFSFTSVARHALMAQRREIKSLFASFSSEKEGSFFLEGRPCQT